MPGKCKRKSNQPTKKPNILQEIDSIIGRIKPSVKVRDECSLARHARCFTEVSAAPPKWLRLHKDDALSVHTTMKKKIKKESKKHRGRKLSTSSDEMESGNVPTYMTNGDETKYNDICSFDSEVDLSGVTLTPADKKIIKENCWKHHQSDEKKKREKYDDRIKWH